MLHPVGDLAPSVYWKRRGWILAVILLAGISVYAGFFRGGGNQEPKSTSAFVSTDTPSATPTSTAPATTAPATPTPTASNRGSSSVAHGAPATCVRSQLSIAASTDASSYPAGARPTVAIVVTNVGPSPCVQDLSDSQIELRIYDGSARVWGSHDCLIQPGTAPATLPVGQPIRREVEWSGLSSTPGCAGVRTRVSAGTYTLYAYLSGQQGKTVTFSLAG